MTVAEPLHKKSVVDRLLYAAALLVVFGISYACSRVAPHFSGGLATLGAVGLLLLAGTLLGELGEIIGLPHLTGYLLAGVLVGPYLLALVDQETVVRLGMVDRLALSLIALAGGAELKLEMLTKGFKSLAWSMFLQCAGGIALMGAVFLALRRMIPFAHALTISQLLGVALLWGMLAITRSPSACLGILSQTKASGPLTRFSVAFIMSSDVVVVVLLAIIITLVRPLLSPDATISMTVFRTLGREVLGSIALGTTIGLVLAAYLHLVGKQLLLVFVVLGFGVNEGINYVEFDPLLAFLVAGFVVQNLSSHGGRFLDAIEQTGGVVYIIFFASAGAHLNVPLFKQLWLVALILCATRAAFTYGIARIAGRLAHDSPAIKNWAFTGLISQAGIALGIAPLIAREFPDIGAGFSALAIAAVGINQLAGPILFQYALERNGEASHAHGGARLEPAEAHS